MLQLTASPSANHLLSAASQGGIADRVRGEFREMPGLALTPAQARRLWSLDATTCNSVLTMLVDTGFLCRRADGAFCRPSDLRGRPQRMAQA